MKRVYMYDADGKPFTTVQFRVTKAERKRLGERAKGFPTFEAWLRAQFSLGPVVAKSKANPHARKVPHKCSRCDEPGHNVMSCKTNFLRRGIRSLDVD